MAKLDGRQAVDEMNIPAENTRMPNVNLPTEAPNSLQTPL